MGLILKTLCGKRTLFFRPGVLPSCSNIICIPYITQNFLSHTRCERVVLKKQTGTVLGNGRNQAVLTIFKYCFQLYTLSCGKNRSQALNQMSGIIFGFFLFEQHVL